MPSTTRRAALAALGSVALGGCSALGVERGDELSCRPADHDWPTYGYDAARTGAAPASDLPPAGADVVRFSATGASPGAGGSVDAPPVVDDGVAYVAGDVRVEARRVDSGERVWASDPEWSVDTSPVLGCGAVFVVGLNGTVAYDRADGTERWRTEGPGGGNEGPGSPALVDDTLYVPGSGLTALDAESGRERWSAAASGSIHGVAVAGRPYAGIGSNGGGGVAAFTDAGETWWETTEGVGPVYSTPAVAGGTVYAASKAGRLAALDADDGSVLWRRSLDGAVHQPPAVADGTVVVGAGNGTRARAFDAATGEERWAVETGVSRSAPVFLGDRVLVAGANTGVWALDSATGDELWYSGDLGNVGSAPVVAGGRLFYRAWNDSEVTVLG